MRLFNLSSSVAVMKVDRLSPVSCFEAISYAPNLIRRHQHSSTRIQRDIRSSDSMLALHLVPNLLSSPRFSNSNLHVPLCQPTLTFSLLFLMIFNCVVESPPEPGAQSEHADTVEDEGERLFHGEERRGHGCRMFVLAN